MANQVRSNRRIAVGSGRSEAAAEKKEFRHVAGSRRIRDTELPVFTRQLATMISAGIPLLEALSTIEDQMGIPAFRTVLSSVRADTEHGKSLSGAMSRFPTVFDEMYVSMLRTGEISGKLAETLENLADHLEFALEMRRKAKSALLYPMVVASIAGFLFLGMMIWIVPSFETIYKDLGGTLPAATQAVVRVSRLLRDHAPLVLGAAIVLVFALRTLVSRSRTCRRTWHSLVLRLPIAGPLALKMGLSRFAESLAQMLQNGIPILHALELTAGVAGNILLQEAILDARTAVSKGQTLSSALLRHKVCPALLTKMLAVGEKTGRIDTMLLKVADFYKKEITVVLSALTSLIEPLMIVLLGTMIGTFVVCMFLPIFKMHEAVAF